MEIEKIQLYKSKDGKMWYDVDLQGRFHPDHLIIELKDLLEMMKQLIDKLEKEQ